MSFFSLDMSTAKCELQRRKIHTLQNRAYPTLKMFSYEFNSLCGTSIQTLTLATARTKRKSLIDYQM